MYVLLFFSPLGKTKIAIKFHLMQRTFSLLVNLLSLLIVMRGPEKQFADLWSYLGAATKKIKFLNLLNTCQVFHHRYGTIIVF